MRIWLACRPSMARTAVKFTVDLAKSQICRFDNSGKQLRYRARLASSFLDG